MSWLTHNRAGALTLAAIVAVGLAAGAFAYWMAAGSGTASTVLASPDQLTLTPGIAESQLTPGHNSSVDVLATNSNPYFVSIGSLMLNTGAGTGGFDVDAGHDGCDLSAIHFAPQDNGGAGWRVPPKVASTDGIRAIDLNDALSMDADAASACQDASLTVHLMAGS